MGKFAVGEIVLVSFPFSNLQGQKIRPALVVAKVEFDNVTLCQITSKPYSSKSSVRIDHSSFTTGKLPVVSYVRPDKLFTTDSSIIRNSAGRLTTAKINIILKSIRALF